MRPSKNMFILSTTATNPFNEKKKDTELFWLIWRWSDLGLGLSEMRLRGGESEGGEGEVRAVLLLAEVETHVMTSLD